VAVTVDPDDAARRLAALIADTAAALQAGRPIAPDADAMRRLIAALGAVPAGRGIAALVAALGPALRARGVTRLVPDELPPSVAAFLEAADEAFGDLADETDFEVLAERLDRTTGGRAAREQALRDQIRREVSASLTETLRARGLVPAADDVDDDEEPDA
jgi:hypothetical protein